MNLFTLKIIPFVVDISGKSGGADGILGLRLTILILHLHFRNLFWLCFLFRDASEIEACTEIG